MILIPKPREISYGEGFFMCTFGTYIVCGEGTEAFPARLLGNCITGPHVSSHCKRVR